MKSRTIFFDASVERHTTVRSNIYHSNGDKEQNILDISSMDYGNHVMFGISSHLENSKTGYTYGAIELSRNEVRLLIDHLNQLIEE